MKVILDASQVYHRYEHGFKYFEEMLPRLVTDSRFHIELIPSPMGLVRLPGKTRLSSPDVFRSARRMLPLGALRKFLSAKKSYLEKWMWERRVSGEEPSLFHSLFYTLPPTSKLPLLTTAHDLIPEKFKMANASVLEHRRKCIESATHLIAVSDCTKRDLVAYYGIAPERVDVIYHGVDAEFFAQGSGREEVTAYRKLHHIEAPYFLQVGGRLHHKNFSALLEAYAMSAAKKDVLLVAVGEPFDEDEKRRIDQLGLKPSVKNIVKAEERDLRTLYQNATALVYPSLYEGFGLPPTEAMAAGAPVIAARAGSIPEVVGDAALLFDPTDISDMSRALDAITNPNVADEFRRLGFKQIERYSWEKCAVQTAEIYLKVLNR